MPTRCSSDLNSVTYGEFKMDIYCFDVQKEVHHNKDETHCCYSVNEQVWILK